MVTYLPTILMNILNQAVVYIETESKYDLIITVNITCMMVLASVYLSISTSLPSTSNIKPIETWLLFNLMYPVLIIISNVILQVRIFVFKFKLQLVHFTFQKIDLRCYNEVVPVNKISKNDKISVQRYFKWAVNYLIPSVYLTFCAVYFVKYLIYGL